MGMYEDKKELRQYIEDTLLSELSLPVDVKAARQAISYSAGMPSKYYKKGRKNMYKSFKSNREQVRKKGNPKEKRERQSVRDIQFRGTDNE